jgi:hypothetical protein
VVAILSGIGSVIWNYIENIVIKPPTDWFSYIINTAHPQFVNTIFHYFGETTGTIVLLVIGLLPLGILKKEKFLIYCQRKKL